VLVVFAGSRGSVQYDGAQSLLLGVL
jgi:hypothetical protein